MNRAETASSPGKLPPTKTHESVPRSVLRAQSQALSPCGILNDSNSTGPFHLGRAFTSASPPERAKIAISISANANLGMRIVALHFLNQFVAAAGSANLHLPSGMVFAAAPPAVSRSSAPISA